MDSQAKEGQDVAPDRPFHNFAVSKSVASLYPSQGSKIVKGPVGYAYSKLTYHYQEHSTYYEQTHTLVAEKKVEKCKKEHFFIFSHSLLIYLV